MRDGVLLLSRHLGKGACIALGNEHRIVTEALCTRHMINDCSLNNTLEQVLLATENQGYNRTETSLTIALALEVFQEQDVVGVEFLISTSDGRFVDVEKDPGIIAFARFETDRTTEGYEEFTLELDYRDLTRTPKYVVISACASKLGDYFTGGVGSVLYVDEFEFIYR